MLKSFLLLFLAGAFAKAEAPVSSSPYVNTLSVEAERGLSRVAGKDPKKLESDADRAEWARARLAWISLARLQGREKDALKLFEECEKVCEKFGPAEEWKAVKAWGCAKKKGAHPCAR